VENDTDNKRRKTNFGRKIRNNDEKMIAQSFMPFVECLLQPSRPAGA
jgi:hypothetical protein